MNDRPPPAVLRRILIWFVIMVILLPLTGFGGAWAWLIVPLIIVAALALRDALSLRGRLAVDETDIIGDDEGADEGSDSVH